MVDRSKASSSTGTIHRAAVACQSCRLRKVKCDAQSVPKGEGCGPCRRAGQKCFLDPLSDGRRSISRKIVDKLQQRIETLEALNQSKGGRLAVAANEEGSATLAEEIVLSGSPDTSQFGNWRGKGQPTNNDSGDPALSQSCHSPHQTSSIPGMTHIGSPESDRGKSPSFYGATSHPHVVSPGDDTRLTPIREVDAVGIDLDLYSPRLRENLLRSFFRYQSLWVDIVNKPSFMAHRASRSDPRWYSEFLENAMLACGTRLSTSKSVRALGARYCELAKNEVLKAMSEPTPANLQGFLLLSEFEVTQGNDRPGWMFCGVASRMLSDLGLHELASTVGPSKETEELTKQSDLAYALLSACVVYEGVWTLYLGRPSSIPISVMNVAASRCKADRKSDSSWLNAWVGLCVPMAEISHILNEKDTSESDRSLLLRKLLRQIEQWYDGLPPELSYNENHLTDMDLAGYGLHTQYCKVQILLRRALARPKKDRKRRYSQMTSDRYPASPDDKDVLIYQHALRIARLVVTYREAFGIEKIPSIMLDNAVVAATEMVHHFKETPTLYEVQDQMIWLRQLIQSMESVQPHFPIIARMLDSLRSICGSGPLFAMVFPIRRDSMDSSAHHAPAIQHPVDPCSTSNNIHDGSFGTIMGSDIVWDCFDPNMTTSVFSSTGFESVVDLVPSEPFISSLT